jgi:hypothetical protein
MYEPLHIAPSTEVGSLGVVHLKRLWSAVMAQRQGARLERQDEDDLDKQVLNALGLGLHQSLSHLYDHAPSFAEFEAWVVATAGQPGRLQVERLNADIAGRPPPAAIQRWVEAIERRAPVLGPDELACWQQHGYVVLKRAVDDAARAAAEHTIWQHVGADPDVPDSWYGRHGKDLHGIMLELIQHPALEANRRSPRIHKAFAQLWGTANLWVSADRCGFHPPQRAGHPFPGPDLHWDVDLARPVGFGSQGILYLTDTPPEQGALTLVPGFQHRLKDWLAALPPGVDPQQQDLHALGARPIGAQAGDMVIWHHALPHGSRPNLGRRPRMVQYINLQPSRTHLGAPTG